MHVPKEDKGASVALRLIRRTVYCGLVLMVVSEKGEDNAAAKVSRGTRSTSTLCRILCMLYVKHLNSVAIIVTPER